MAEVFIGEITMRSGDRLPLLAVAIEDDEGVPVDLTDAATADFWLLHEDGIWPLSTPKPDPDGKNWLVLPGMIVDAPQGIVAYDWGTITSDLVPGVLDLVVVVAFRTAGETLSAPTDDTALLYVRPAVTIP
ncbi:MAG: hypothetical protein ABW122_14290 [Ilumatobacteraceae bacterium]